MPCRVSPYETPQADTWILKPGQMWKGLGGGGGGGGGGGRVAIKFKPGISILTRLRGWVRDVGLPDMRPEAGKADLDALVICSPAGRFRRFKLRSGLCAGRGAVAAEGLVAFNLVGAGEVGMLESCFAPWGVGAGASLLPVDSAHALCC